MTNAKNLGALVSKSFGEAAYSPVGEPLTAQECKILNRVAKSLIKLGAASQERLAKVCRFETRTIQWALHWLGAETNASELHWLP